MTGWVTGAQKCSHVLGLAWQSGWVLCGCVAIAESAAAEYWRGDRSASCGDLQRSDCGGTGGSGVVDCAVGGAIGAIMGANLGGVAGGLFVCVRLRCTRGAVHRMCLAVGLVDE